MIAGIPLDNVGYAIVGLFAVGHIAALAVWRYGRIEDRRTQIPMAADLVRVAGEAS